MQTRFAVFLNLFGALPILTFTACNESPGCNIDGPNVTCASVIIEGDLMTIVQGDGPIESVSIDAPVGVQKIDYSVSSQSFLALAFVGENVGNIEEISLFSSEDTFLAVDTLNAVALQTYEVVGSEGSSAVETSTLQDLDIRLKSWEYHPTIVGNVRDGVRVNFANQPFACRARLLLDGVWPLSRATIDEVNRCLQVTGTCDSSVVVTGHEGLVLLEEVEEAFPTAGRVTFEDAV